MSLAFKGIGTGGELWSGGLGTEAVRVAAHFGNTAAGSNRDVQYDILSPTGTHPDGFNTPKGGFCAWHDWNGDPYVGVTSPYGDIAFTKRLDRLLRQRERRQVRLAHPRHHRRCV